MQLATTIATVISSLSFAIYGAGCFLSREMAVEFERYRLGSMRPVIGALQIAASVGLLAGLAFPPLLALSAGGLAAMMLLAVLVRVRIRDPWYAALPALGFLALNLYIVWTVRPR